jgi:hypothetical protein
MGMYSMLSLQVKQFLMIRLSEPALDVNDAHQKHEEHRAK